AVVHVRREPHHLEDHLVAFAGVLGAGVAHVHRAGEQVAVDPHTALAFAFEVGADKAVGLPFEDLGDVAFGAAAIAGASQLDHDQVAGDGVARVFGGDVDIGLAVLLTHAGQPGAARSHEAVAFRGALVDAHDGVDLALLRYADHVFAAVGQLAPFDQFFDGPADIHGPFFQPQFLG